MCHTRRTSFSLAHEGITEQIQRENIEPVLSRGRQKFIDNFSAPRPDPLSLLFVCLLFHLHCRTQSIPALLTLLSLQTNINMSAATAPSDQIRQMVNFILQEAHEKANEIRVKVSSSKPCSENSKRLERAAISTYISNAVSNNERI